MSTDAARAAQAERFAVEQAAQKQAAQEKVDAEKAAVRAKLAAFKQAFLAIRAACQVLEAERQQSPREVRQDGTLGTQIATASSAASEGLQLIAMTEQQLVD